MVIEESDTPTMFMGGSAHGFAPVERTRFEDALRHPSSAAGDLRRQIAYGLFATAAIAPNPEVRLSLLVMAIEALLEPEPRSTVELEVIEAALALVGGSPVLSPEQRDGLRGVLNSGRRQSIGATGRAYVSRLGDRLYGGYTAVNLFKKAYKVRSDLTHGNLPRPQPAEVGALAAPLEVLVAHLIAGRAMVDDLVGPAAP
jgi:hypothetical protein